MNRYISVFQDDTQKMRKMLDEQDLNKNFSCWLSASETNLILQTAPFIIELRFAKFPEFLNRLCKSDRVAAPVITAGFNGIFMGENLGLMTVFLALF